MNPDLWSLLEDHEIYHSELQMDSFITGRAGGTLYGCFKQAQRELFKRTRGLIELYTDRSLLQVDIDEWEFTKDKFDRKRAKIKNAKRGLEMIELQKNIEHTEREFLHFYAQVVACRQALEAKGVSFPLSAEARHKLDLEMWEHRLLSRAALEFLTQGTLQFNTAEFIQASPPDMRQRIADRVFVGPDARHQLIDWFLNQQPQLPEPAEIGTIDIGKLIGIEGAGSAGQVDRLCATAGSDRGG